MEVAHIFLPLLFWSQFHIPRQMVNHNIVFQKIRNTTQFMYFNEFYQSLNFIFVSGPLVLKYWIYQNSVILYLNLSFSQGVAASFGYRPRVLLIEQFSSFFSYPSFTANLSIMLPIHMYNNYLTTLKILHVTIIHALTGHGNTSHTTLTPLCYNKKKGH